MKWHASLDISLGYLTTEKIKKNPEQYKEYFEDLDNPTDEEIQVYFEDVQQNYAGSNDGSELIANADIEITKIIKS